MLSHTRSLARDSDIRLTLQTVTHVALHDQRAAIQSLPGPTGSTDQETGAGLRVTG
jgi:hypothetical protein